MSPEPTFAQLAKQEQRTKAQRVLQEKKKAAAQNNSHEYKDDTLEQVQHDELSAIALKFKALEKEKANLNAQLATNQRAAAQAKKLADAKCKLAAMQAEVEKLQKACEDTQELHHQTSLHTLPGTSHHTEAHNLR